MDPITPSSANSISDGITSAVNQDTLQNLFKQAQNEEIQNAFKTADRDIQGAGQV
jgi:hypothetical protein